MFQRDSKVKKFCEWLEQLLEAGGTKKDIALLTAGAVSVAMSLAGIEPFPFEVIWIAIILCGAPIVAEAFIGLVTAFDIKADVLVSMALIASLLIGENFAAGEVAFIMQLGAFLEDLTVARARAGIEKLIALTPQTARVVRDGIESVIAAADVLKGDLIRVLPGETVPADGRIVKGETSVNESVMTGEPLPVDKGPGDAVSSGTVNQFGAFEMTAEKVGEDSAIRRMARLVQSADAGKAKIVRLADRWATWIVIAAFSTALLTWLLTGEIIRAVTILVVFCPCALVLATPTAIMAAIGNATKHGFLVREGDALERLADVRAVAFDKTGTLTYGRPRVAAVRPVPPFTEGELFALAAGAEQFSEHPLGKAVVAEFRKTGAPSLPAASNFRMLPGRGVTAMVSGRQVAAGNPALMKDLGIALPAMPEAEADAARGCTLIRVAADGRFAGILALADTVREDAAATVEGIRSLGAEPVLITGDHRAAAAAIGGALGIGRIEADCRPEDKLAFIGREEAAGTRLCMVGDGVNDAPALKRAHVGIAMGGVGSDIAVDASDIVLISDDVRELPHLLALARRTMTTIRLNMTFAMTVNLIAVVLAITGILSPVAGALVHNGGSVLVITNSAFLLRWRKNK